MQPTLQSIQAIIVRYVDIPIGAISLQKNIRTELGASSLDLINIISEVEKLYHVKISRRMLKNIHTVEDIIRLVKSILEQT